LLTVSEVLADGSEVIVQTFDGLFAVTKKVEGLKHRTRYKFRIYTRCADGTPSLIPSEVDIITLIIELTLAGRKPVNPQPVNCTGIEYNDPEYDWVGFRLRRMKGDNLINENYFEFDRQGSTGELVIIKRAETANRLVAANDQGTDWPTINVPIVNTPNPIRAAETREFEPHKADAFASIVVGFNYGWTETVDLCGTIYPGQQTYFVYEAMVAQKVEEKPSQGLVSNRNTNDDISIVNPIFDFVEILNPGLYKESNILLINIYDAQGKLLKHTKESSSEGTILVDVRDVPTGLLFLSLCHSDGCYTYPLIKQ
jgi:hypothetical protein